MKKLSVIVFMLIVSILFSVPVYAQSAKEAIFGLKKLQARCQSGISYHDIVMPLPMQNSLSIYLWKAKKQKKSRINGLHK